MTTTAEARLRLVFDGAPIGMALVAPDGRFLEVNPALCTILGRSEAELLELRFHDVTHPDDLDDDVARVDRVLAGAGDGYRVEKRYLRPDGSIVLAQLDVVVVRDEDGRPVHFISQVQDTTDRRAAIDELAEAHAIQRASLDALEQGVVLAAPTGEVLLMNEAARRILDASEEQLSSEVAAGRWAPTEPDGTPIPVEERPIVMTALTGEPVRERLVGITRTDGHRVVLRVSTDSVRDDDGRVSGVVTAFTDVTAEHAAEQARLSAEAALQATTAWYSALVERSSDITCVVDAAGKITYVSPAGQRLWGDTSEGPGMSFLSLIHTTDRDRLATALMDLVAHPGSSRTAACRILVQGMEWRHVEIVATNRLADPDVAGIVANVRDVTERAEAEARLRWQAFHDPLTGLPNRALLMERLDEAVLEARADGATAALLFIDVDRFKVVNDTMGHAAGDALLTEVAARIRSSVRATDTVARLGGDEFVVLTETPARRGDVLAMAGRIGAALSEPVGLAHGAVTVSSSIGIAFDAGSEPRDLLRHADLALYRAKQQGKDRFEVFDDSMHHAALRHLTMERELRAALQEDSLEVHFQPVADLLTGVVHGTEALLRVPDGTGAPSSPAEHVAVADESGLIVPVGAVVMDRACAALAGWRAALGPRAPGHVAVNVTGRQLASPRFAGSVLDSLARHRLDPHHLVLELTESTVIGADRATHDCVSELSEAGIGLAIDDFGTRYSSLANLKRFPISIVKLDRTFVSGVGQDRSDTAIIRAVISLGDALGLTVVAEGIETPEQLDTLRDLGCTKGQGYLIARPAPAADLAAHLDQAAAVITSSR